MITDRKSIMLRKKEELSRGDYLCIYLPVNIIGQELNQIRNDQISTGTVRDLLKQKAALLIYENSEFQVYKLTYNKIPFLNR
jgi:hypothetical protein